MVSFLCCHLYTGSFLFMILSARQYSCGGLGVERLLHKKHDSAPVDQSLLGAWYCIYILSENNSCEITMLKNNKLKAVINGQPLFSLRNNGPEKIGC